MQKLSVSLKYKLLILGLIFPLSFAAIGVLAGLYFHQTGLIIALSIAGFAVGIILNVVCFYRKLFTFFIYKTPTPLALFLMFWSIGSAFFASLHALFIGLIGLVIGLLINRVLVHPFQFYRIPKRVLAIVYLFFSIALMGFFMGIPFFNLLLGVLAGNYLSIRVLSNIREQKAVERNLVQGSLFTAVSLFFVVILSLYIFGLDVENEIVIINQTLGLTLNGNHLMLYLFGLGIISSIAQYFITLHTAKIMLKYRRLQEKIT